MVRLAVEQGAGQPLGAEDLGPLVEQQVARRQDRVALIALAEDLEKQFRSGPGQVHEAQSIDDQKPAGGQLLLKAQQTLLVRASSNPLTSAAAVVKRTDNPF